MLGQDFKIHAAASRGAAVNLVRGLSEAPPLALIDLGLPPLPHEPEEGYRLISALLSHAPAMKIIVLSGQSEVAAARHARSLGGDCIPAACRPSLRNLARVLLEALKASEAESAAPEDQAASPLDTLIGLSAPMAGLKTQVGLYADSPFPVLVEGESGSGKEVVASCLHALGPRRAKPYLALNCAAIAPSLVEPTLFGYAKGAFTGAQTSKAGYFEDAQDGTLFLDEIGELPIALPG